ncbi:hypothetical protein SSX86_016757 [Deinandra increscens subsp. villosa]|uniref:Uncharacterized protein n=1 Tax=Deinandra increscens subsp. villosa TaxID=3103831 RepID=A0AAP0CYS7_9ASTR
MDSGGGTCIARYTRGGSIGGFGEITYGMSKVEIILLKFKVIAKKPMAAGSSSSCSTAEHSDRNNGNLRRKRRYVRVNGNKKKDTNGISRKQRVSSFLMSETPDQKEISQACRERIQI